MGIYLNTGVKKFNSALQSKIYVDKTGFLEYTNSVIDTEDRYICLSRPRRFGKSITAAMLAAYYGKGFDSSALFDGRRIAQSADYQKYMNQYDVIQVDMNVFRHRLDPQTAQSISASETVILFQKEVVREIREAYPGSLDSTEIDLPNALTRVHEMTGSIFIVIIDEWDTIFREDPDDEEAQKQYLKLLRGLFKDDVIEMLGGGHCRANPDKFQNDMVTFRSRDDVFALLIHLGYLAFDHDRREVYIPNEEIRSEFVNAIEGSEWNTVVSAITASDKLLRATLKKEEEKVADAIGRVHMENISVIRYNDENSLSCVITLAYYSAMKDYVLIREFPTGEGFADIVFLPRQHTDSPALLVELKYDHTAESAIDQIRTRKYTGKLMDYSGTVLLVGISYDRKTRLHQCRIEDAVLHERKIP